MPSRVRFQFKEDSVREIKNSPGVTAKLRAEAEAIVASAKAIFQAQVKHDQPVTPPPYLDRFGIRRIRRLEDGSVAFEAFNDDEAAFWVEFGAYLPQNKPFERYPNHPQILKYRPFGLAMDMAARMPD